MNALSKMYNFTWTVEKEPNDDWGTVPKTGTHEDDNATFGGVLGDVIYGTV